MANFQILRTELVSDPLTRGYAGMTDQEAADSLNTADRDFWRDLCSAEIFEAMEPSEFASLTGPEQVRADRILSLGAAIKTTPASNSRAELLDLFGPSSATIAALAALARELIPRVREIGFARSVSANGVFRARG